jgi:hypothetical protein
MSVHSSFERNPTRTLPHCTHFLPDFRVQRFITKCSACAIQWLLSYAFNSHATETFHECKFEKLKLKLK